jgi:uncharacterized protein YdhG (YjbR/CyaY superfamily)
MAGPATVEDYLAALPAQRREALEQMRATIRAAAPNAVESIAYRMPALRIDGHFLVSYAAFGGHYSLFPASARVVDELGDAVRPYLSGKGTIRFPLNAPLPTELIARIAEARVREVAEALATRVPASGHDRKRDA